MERLHAILVPAFTVALTLVPATAGAQDHEEGGAALEPGHVLYAQKGCLGCHGASARGEVGPPLARTRLSFEAFLNQLRRPRGIMPRFAHTLVSDQEARAIYRYLETAPAADPRLRAELPHGKLDPASCAGCHRNYNPVIVRQFETSAMGRAGVQNRSVDFPRPQLTCADCHGTNHDTIMASRGRVPEVTCGGCHAQIYKDHVTDAGHSYGPGPGTLGTNWERNIGVPHYQQMPRVVMEMGCDPCHAQAGATDAKYWSTAAQRYIDTSSLIYRNGCIACHTRHSFSLEEARKPEACYTCHMGPDHPNYEAYMSSKHGSIYAARGDNWDWARPLAQADWEAPTCAYCHMLYVGADGRRSSSHNMTSKIIWGMGVQAAAGELTDLATQPEARQKRNEMLKVCLTCHSEDKARDYLRSADGHKLAGDALVVEARGILAELYDDGLIEPSHGSLAAALLAGPRYTALELPTSFAQHWPAGLYFDVTAIEREYFDLFFFSNLKSYKGAFHMSPDYAWWYGYADVLGHLARIRDEAQRLRDARSTRNRTLFMIFTGPLMVLGVLAALYLAWRFWRRRRQQEGS
ncbi:MAG: c-type cytochrome [Gemmatimonadetes bacterium]|nr:c-type cytochrome [Gemmatimonadota bacterium]